MERIQIFLANVVHDRFKGIWIIELSDSNQVTEKSKRLKYKIVIDKDGQHPGLGRQKRNV